MMGLQRASLAHSPMDQATPNKIVSFLWGIADDVLRDLFKRGKYPNAILTSLEADCAAPARPGRVSDACTTRPRTP